MSAQLETSRDRLLGSQLATEETIRLEDARSLTEHAPIALRQADIHLDKSLIVRKACLLVLGLSYIGSLASLAASIYLYVANIDASYFDNGRTWSAVTDISPAARAILSLVLSTIVTTCTEAMGYIHSVTLRWALLRERRLQYSSNLRLLSCAHRSWPNSMWANSLFAIALVFSYVGASQALVSYTSGGQYPAPPRNGALANGPALLVLGLGLLIQAVISTACLLQNFSRTPTWSSNIFIITLACLQERPDTLQRKKDRCLLSAYSAIHERHEGVVKPHHRQPSMLLTDPGTRHIVRFIWFLPLVVLSWAIVVAVLVAVLPTQQANVIGYFPSLNLSMNTVPGLFTAIVIVGAFQAFATIGLHAVELLVTRYRDEQCWRRASKTPGVTGNNNRSTRPYISVMAGLTSWQSLSLFILKPLIHWLFGSSLTTSNFYGRASAYMDYRYIFPLAAATLVLAAFATVLSHHEPRGAMPSAWGHLQTLADLIDDWGDGEAEEICWGDKGWNSDGTRHAGTATDTSRLNAIVMGAEYR